VIDAGAGTAAFRIAGVEAGWSSREIGEPLRLVVEARVANPLIVIDEIDRAGGGMRSASGVRTSMSDALLPLLDAGTARSWRCPASHQAADLSRLSWILTANEIDGVDRALRSRLEVVRVPRPSASGIELFARMQFAEDPELGEAAAGMVERLAVHRDFSLRHAARVVERVGAYRSREQLH
jgi:ATP-dependent Lon protease